MESDCQFQPAAFGFFSENFQCLCLLIIIPNAYHIKQVKKSEGKDKLATRIRNKSWTDYQSLEEAIRNYNRQGF